MHEWSRSRQGRTARWAIPPTVLILAALVACTPLPPGGSTTTTVANPTVPTVYAFTATSSGPAPSVVTLGWKVGGPNPDALSCRIDGNGDGSFETTVSNCKVAGSRNVSINAPGSYTARIELDDGVHPPVTATRSFSIGAGTAEPFNIDLRGLDGLDPAVAAVFETAAARWEQVIVRGLPDVPGAWCSPAGFAPLPAIVDDLIVDVSTPYIDGPGQVLGSAGPTCVSTSTQLGFHGIMRFDEADVDEMLADGTLAAVVEHELGHVLGIGTLWDMSWSQVGTRRLLKGAGGASPTFTGVAATAELSRMGRTGAVPVEGNSAPPGTADAHWRESVFRTELMTGWIDDSTNPMSRMTIASLADLGYRVDLSKADSYSLPGVFGALRAAPQDDHLHLHMERPPIEVAG